MNSDLHITCGDCFTNTLLIKKFVMIGSPLFPLFKIFPDDCTYNISWKGELCKHHVLVVQRRSKAINRINQCGVDSVLFTILMLDRLKDSLNHIGRTRNTSFTHCFSPSLFVESLPVNLYSRGNSATYSNDVGEAIVFIGWVGMAMRNSSEK